MHTPKKFIHYYGPYKAVFFIDLLCAAIISLVDLSYPQILRTATKTLFTQDKSMILHALPWIGIGLFLMYVIQSLCKYYVSYQGHMMGANMERDLRQQLFEHYEELSFSYYGQNNSGQMMSKLVSDLFDISEFAHHGPENLFISLIKIVGAFIFLFVINRKLALPLIFLVIVMFFFSFRQNQKMQRTFMENRRKIGDVNASLQDTLAGIRVVQSFTNEDIEKEKFRRSNQAFLVSKKDNYRCMGEFMSSNLFFQGMMYLVTLVYGGFLIANGEMSAADLAMYALYIGIFISPIQILVELMPDIQDAPDAVDLANVKGHVCYEDVSFHYSDDETTVLSHVSIDIPAGRSVALVGPSGGGKTTICSLLPRFYDVTDGRITIDGHDVRTLTLKSLRSRIGVVQQDVYLFSGSIRDNIAYGKPNASEEEIIAAAKRANIHDFIMELPDQYDTFVGERGARLSGGQKQRISIARVFLKNPPILILDEATSALDNESERWIQHSLEELSRNRTTITIAHRLSTIKNADEIIVLTENGIAERGTHETLLDKNGIYAAYYNMT